MNPGWVYILTNESLQSDYLKIGRTTNDPTARASDISSATGVATPFKVAYSEAVADCVKAELLVHRKLADYRVNNKREFFQIDLDSAMNGVQEICESIRNESPFCSRCKAKADKAELDQSVNTANLEVAKLQDQLQKHKMKVKHLQRQISIFTACRNFISKLLSTVSRAYQRVTPEIASRRIITWGIIFPLCLAAWFVVLIISPITAASLVLTLLLFSALVVIGSVQQEDCSSE